jgi:hypothetical protein
MVVRMIDEIDGSQADETIYFKLDGAEFELKLSKDHAEELRRTLEPYIKAGRKTGSKRNGHRRGSQPTRINTIQDLAKATQHKGVG